MSFEEKLNIDINSVFDRKGFRRLSRELDEIEKKVAPFSDIFNAAEKTAGREKFFDDFKRRIDQTSFSINKMSDEMNDFNQIRRAIRGGSLEVSDKFDNASQAARKAVLQIDRLGGTIQDANGVLRTTGELGGEMKSTFELPDLGDRNLSEKAQTDSIADGITQTDQIQREVDQMFSDLDFSRDISGSGSMAGEALAQAGFSTTLDEHADSLTSNLNDVSRQSESTTRRFSLQNLATDRMNELFGMGKARLAGFERGVKSLLPNLQALQMELLGIQFQLLTLSFLLGGLLLPAIGAAGIFEILGNTLKLLFLPTALDLIPVVMDIRDALLGLSENARESLGRFLIFGAAITGFASILAFAANGLLSIASAAKLVLSPITKLINAFAFFKTGKTGMAALKALGSGGAAGGLKTLGATASKVALPLTLLVGIITGLTAVVKRFPKQSKKIKNLAGAFGVLGTLAKVTLKNLKTMAKGFVNIFQGLFTFFAAKLFGDPEKQVKGASEFGQGVFQLLVQPVLNFLEGLNDQFLESGVKLGASLLKGLIGVITNQEEGLFEKALKRVLPTQLFTAVGNFLDMKEFEEELTSKIDSKTKNLDIKPADMSPFEDFKPESTMKQKQTVNKNNMSFSFGDINTDKGNKTPIEAGKGVAEGFTKPFNVQQSSILQSGT